MHRLLFLVLPFRSWRTTRPPISGIFVSVYDGDEDDLIFNCQLTVATGGLVLEDDVDASVTSAESDPTSVSVVGSREQVVDAFDALVFQPCFDCHGVTEACSSCNDGLVGGPLSCVNITVVAVPDNPVLGEAVASDFQEGIRAWEIGGHIGV